MTESRRKLEPHELWREEKWWCLELPDGGHKASSVSPECLERRYPGTAAGHAERLTVRVGPQ